MMKYLVLLSLTAFSIGHCNANAQQTALPTNCYEVPSKANSLWLIETSAQDMPVNDVVFYLKDEFGRFVLLDAIKGDVAHIFFNGFSTGGKYTVITTAEEGHPNFLIYPTDKFLSPTRPLKAYAVISNYFITRIALLTDDGEAIIELLDSPSNINSSQQCLPTKHLPENSDKERCHIRYSIHHKHK